MILRFLLTIIVVLAASRYVPGITVDSIQTAVLVSVIWGIVSVTIKPILSIVSLPIQILTLGLFNIVINIALLMVIAHFVNGFSIADIKSAFILIISVSIANMTANLIS